MTFSPPVSMTKRVALFFALLAIGGCKPKSINGLYCEGGVRDGKGEGGECVQITSDIHDDTDPTAVGSAVFMTTFTQRHSVRRVNRTHYTLFLHGVSSGTIDADGTWLHITKSSGIKIHVRSDAPGVFI